MLNKASGIELLKYKMMSTYLFLNFILFLFAQGSFSHCHFSNAERFKFALKKRLLM